MAKFKIQFVSANEVAGARLQIDKELRGITAALGSQVDIPTTPAARLDDVIRALKDGKPKPDIVHFSAHGSPTGEIILLDGKDDQPKPLATAAFEQLFKVLKGNVRLVTLNACFSAPQARKIAKYIDCVIGIEETIPDNVASASYTALLYEELAKGKSVKDAFEISRIPILDARLPRTQQPQLITRKAVDPAKIFIGRTKRTVKAVKARPAGSGGNSSLKAKQIRYADNESRYGVWAESLSLTKVCNADGSSLLHYELKNLQVRNGEIKGIRFAVESTAGLVGAPVRDRNAIDLAITWETDRPLAPQTMDDVVEQARTLRGSFHFGQPLRQGSSYTFGWTLKIFNNDALTAWEFYNLYSTKQQLHVDGKPLGGPIEYFARLEWFPVKQLVLTLDLPSGISAKPRLRVFGMKDNLPMPKDEIVYDDKLWFLPRAGSAWYTQNGRWETVLDEQKNEIGALQCKERQSTLTIDYPQLGAYYSLDWDLPQPPVKQFLIREADVVRAGLLRHRSKRIQKVADPVAEQITQWFSDLHENIWKRYSSKRPEDQLQTSFITYDKEELKLRVVEGRVNNADLDEKSWQFWLPFGLGLAGHCFRSGKTVRYLRPLDAGDPEQPENYLPVPGATDYECLIAFPIDHPKLTEQMAKDSGLPRGRQLAGVLTIGSTFRASQLYHLCRGEALKAKVQELKELRDECQRVCDLISGLILNGNSVNAT